MRNCGVACGDGFEKEEIRHEELRTHDIKKEPAPQKGLQC